jgi:hypothetical protein
MRLICFDNHVLIWGIKEQATEGQEDNIPKAKRFIGSLASDDIVLIPSVVVAEYLIPIPVDKHAKILKMFNRNFFVAPFDARAASKFSQIWQTNKPSEIANKVISEQKTRAELRADSMIVAIAVAQKAECIYSHDKHVKNFAKGFIEVKEIPFIPEQSTYAPPDDKRDWGKLPKSS